jgi:hypothetical protein
MKMNSSRQDDLLGMKAIDAFAYLLIVAMLACECSLFFLSFLPPVFFEICGYNAKYLSSAFAFLGFLMMLLLACRGEKVASFLFGVPISAYVIMCVSISFVSAFAYGIALKSVLIVSVPSICIPLLYFALHGMVKNNKLYEYFIQATIVFAAVYAVLCLVEASGASIMNETYQFTSVRNGRLRIIVSGDFVTFGAVVALGRAFATKKGRVLNSTLFAIMAFELYWVAQTRFLLVGLTVAASFGFVISGKNKMIKIVCMSLAALTVLSQFSPELTSFFFPGEQDVSGIARAHAYTYYWSHIADLGVFGLGYIPADSSQYALLSMVTTAGFERGDITDIGIVGYLARYGFCGAIVLALAIIWFIRVIRQNTSDGFRIGTNPETWMSFVLFVAICPTMAISDPQRIFYLPILALMIEHALLFRFHSGHVVRQAPSDPATASLGGSLG